MDAIDRKTYGRYGLQGFRLQDESGQTVVLAAFCMALLLGFLALAVDVGILFHARRTAQTAADSGAIAAAEEVNYGDVTIAAQADAALNGVSDSVQGATVTVNQPPSSGPYAGEAGYVEVITRLPEATFFMSMFGTHTVSVEGRAVATSVPTQTCIFTLDPTNTSFEMSGGANVQMPGCGVLDESSSSTALQVSGGSTLNVGSIGVVGGYSSTGGSSISPQPSTGIGPTSDPLLNLVPPSFASSSCLADPNIGNGAQLTLGSGGTTCYNGLTIGGGSTVNLNPGVYVINGTFSVSNGASLIGDGVTFYLTQGSVFIGGGSVINLEAPTTGIYNGILFFQDRTDTQSASISNGANSVLEGILYFPAAPLAFSGGTSTRTYATVIANTLNFSGGTTLKNYSIVNPGTPLTAPRLVE
jgi:Flp pilus assembly protein TadG